MVVDLDLDDKILTSTDMPDLLTKKGWNYREVASTLMVGSAPLQWSSWNDASMEYLGGKHCLSLVGDELSSKYLTSKVKRARELGFSTDKMI